MKCSGFTAGACIDGSCPLALKDSDDDRIADIASDMYTGLFTCDDCYHKTYECSDCIWHGTDMCEKEVKYGRNDALFHRRPKRK